MGCINERNRKILFVILFIDLGLSVIGIIFGAVVTEYFYRELQQNCNGSYCYIGMMGIVIIVISIVTFILASVFICRKHTEIDELPN